MTETALYGEMTEWLMVSVLKTDDVKASGGSNPSLPARINNKE
jgi:hypothetical protein